MIAVNTGKTIENLTISYYTFDCNGQTANITNNILDIPYTKYSANQIFSGILTFDNNTVLQSRSDVSIQLSSADSVIPIVVKYMLETINLLTILV